MKTLLLLALVGCVVLLAFQNESKKKEIEAIQQREVARAEEETSRELRSVRSERDRLKSEAGQLKSERDQAFKDRDQAEKDRDDARAEAVAASNEIARLTNTTPKPMNWFEKRQAESGGKLDAPPASAGRVRSNYYYPPQ